MQKAKDIFDKWKCLYDMYIDYDQRGYDAIISAIKEAQKDAIEETVRECAKSVYINRDTYPDSINKQSILSVADKLIKKINNESN